MSEAKTEPSRQDRVMRRLGFVRRSEPIPEWVELNRAVRALGHEVLRPVERLAHWLSVRLPGRSTKS